MWTDSTNAVFQAISAIGFHGVSTWKWWDWVWSKPPWLGTQKFLSCCSWLYLLHSWKICVGWGLECYGRHGRWSKMFDWGQQGSLCLLGCCSVYQSSGVFLDTSVDEDRQRLKRRTLMKLMWDEIVCTVRGPRAMWHSVLLRQRYPTPGIIYDKVGLILRFCWWLSADMNEIGSILINSVMFQLGDSVYNVYSDSFSKHSGGWGVCQQLELLLVPPLHPPKNYRSLISIWRILPTGIIGQLGCSSVMFRVCEANLHGKQIEYTDVSHWVGFKISG